MPLNTIIEGYEQAMMYQTFATLILSLITLLIGIIIGCTVRPIQIWVAEFMRRSE